MNEPTSAGAVPVAPCGHLEAKLCAICSIASGKDAWHCPVCRQEAP